MSVIKKKKKPTQSSIFQNLYLDLDLSYTIVAPLILLESLCVSTKETDNKN